jgi:hypothetical protein
VPMTNNCDESVTAFDLSSRAGEQIRQSRASTSSVAKRENVRAILDLVTDRLAEEDDVGLHLNRNGQVRWFLRQHPGLGSIASEQRRVDSRSPRTAYNGVQQSRRRTCLEGRPSERIKGDRDFVNAPTLRASRKGKFDAHVSVRVRRRHRSRPLSLFRKGLPGRVQLAQPLLVRLARDGVAVLAVDEVKRTVQV